MKSAAGGERGALDLTRAVEAHHESLWNVGPAVEHCACIAQKGHERTVALRDPAASGVAGQGKVSGIAVRSGVQGRTVPQVSAVSLRQLRTRDIELVLEGDRDAICGAGPVRTTCQRRSPRLDADSRRGPIVCPVSARIASSSLARLRASSKKISVKPARRQGSLIRRSRRC